MLRAFATLLIVLSASHAEAQKLQFRQLTPDDGLLSSQIDVITQDSRGFMWLGSFRGLSRYDGYSFIVYRHKTDDTTSLADNHVNSVYEDHERNLWVGTNAGLSQYDRAHEAFRSYRVTPSETLSVQVMYEARGKLLVGTNRGLYEFDRKSGKAAPFAAATFAKLSVWAIYEDRRGRLWFGTETAGAIALDSASGSAHSWTNDQSKPTSLPGKDVRGFSEDASGAMWVSSYDGGLARLDVATGIATRFTIDPSDPLLSASKHVRALLPDGVRGLWVGTENGGLDYFDFATHQFKHNRFDPNNPSGINNNSVWTVFRDQSGSLWIGTWAGGINITKQNGEAIRRFRSVAGDANSLSFNSVMSFAEDARGGMWVATDGGGLNRFDRSTGRFTRFNSHTANLNSDAVLAIAEDRAGMLWIGTWAGGMSRFDPKTGQFTAFTNKNSGVASIGIFSLHTDRAGVLWIGTWHEGLQRYDPAHGGFTTFPISQVESPIHAIVEASDGHLMLATESGGFVIFDPRTSTKKTYLAGKDGISSNQVTSVLEGEPGIVWIGTSAGLDRLDRNTNVITHFTDADGLASSYISALTLDAQHQLWVSGDRGLTRFDPKTKKGKIYTAVDGLQGTEFNGSSAFRSRDGTLYFGGPQGFNTLRPDSIVQNTHIPQIAITGLQLFSKPVLIGAKGSPLETSITVAKRLDLAHKQSVFTIEFAALDFVASQRNQYAYKLEGLDKEWNEIGTKRSASYTNLPAGSYTFRVKGSNNDEVWNTEGASLVIHVAPPFWASWWFRTLLLIAAIAAARYALRASRARRENLERVNVTLAEAAERDRRSQQYLERNVLEVLGAMERFSAGDLAVSLPVEKDDAIGKLRDGFNTAVANIHAMVKQVRDVLDATVTTSRHIHGQTIELSRGAEEQIDQALVVASAAQQMTESAAANSRSIAEASEIARRSGTEAQAGGIIVRETFAGMDDMVTTVSTSAASVATLGESSEQISAITRVIEQISQQAELLSLNAAIEAAHAGQHGRSFAVVATEMRHLAERTATAASEIAKVITKNEHEVSTAVKAMTSVSGQMERGREMVEKAGAALDGIIDNADLMLACIQQASSSSEEQSAATVHITENVETISRVTHQAVRGNQTIATSVKELSALIEDLQQRVSRFQLADDVVVIADSAVVISAFPFLNP
ncbi:MAG: two-component regulator propeller domain-containing protein [bacterium]